MLTKKQNIVILSFESPFEEIKSGTSYNVVVGYKYKYNYYFNLFYLKLKDENSILVIFLTKE